MLTLSLKSPLLTLLGRSQFYRIPQYSKLLSNLTLKSQTIQTIFNAFKIQGGELIQSNSFLTFQHILGIQVQQTKTEDNILQINTFKRKKAKVKKSKRKQRRKKLRRLSEQKREKRNY